MEQIVPADRCSRSNPNKPSPFNAILFKTDVQGRFRVDNVPAGRVAIRFKRRGHIVLTQTRVAYVLDGQSTEVRFCEPSDAWSADVAIRRWRRLSGADSHPAPEWAPGAKLST